MAKEKDPQIKVGQKIKFNKSQKKYVLKNISYGNVGIPNSEDPSAASYEFVGVKKDGNSKEYFTKKTFNNALLKKWIVKEGILKEKIDHMQKADKNGRHPKYKHLVYFELEPHHGSYILTAPDTVRRKDALLSYDDAKSMLGKDFVDREFGYASDEYLDLLEQKTLSKLQSAYREFFLAKMEEFGVKSPTQLKSSEEKKKFWNSIKKEWPTAKRQIKEGVLRKEIRNAISDILEDMIPGGKSDEVTEQDVDPRELEMGIEVEMEHTSDPAKAKEIAFDHLEENPKYYSDLMAYGMVDEPGAIKTAKRLGKKVGQTHTPTTHKGSATASKPVARAYEGKIK